jgi:transposase, IS5 family
METTAANVHDAKVLGELLHGNQTRVYGDQAYRGQKHVIRDHAPNARDFTNQRYRHRGAVDEPHEIQCARQSRASVSGTQ